MHAIIIYFCDFYVGGSRSEMRLITQPTYLSMSLIACSAARQDISASHFNRHQTDIVPDSGVDCYCYIAELNCCQ